MKKIVTPLLIICVYFFSCSTPPRDYFNQAALNCNLLYGFAGNGMQRELATPAVKLSDEKTGATVSMKRTEIVNDKIITIEGNFEKVKKLPVTDDSKPMLYASIALYEFVLPVYRNEYMQLATLYDESASASDIEAMEKMISEKYEATFLQLYNAVLITGKAYAGKHGISVMEVNPSPVKKQ